MTHIKPTHSWYLTKRNVNFTVLVLYVVLVLVFSGTLLSQGNNSLIGENYAGALPIWATWWPGHALANDYNMFSSTYIAYPIDVNHTPILSLASSFLYSLLAPVSGPYLSYHLILPLYLLLDAFVAYVFFSRYTKHITGAVLAGLVIAFNPLTWQWAANGEFAQLGVFPLLLAFLAWDELIAKPDIRRLLLAVGSVYLVILMAIQYWELIIVLWLPYAVYRVVQTPDRKPIENQILLGVVILGLLTAFYPLPAIIGALYTGFYDPIQVWSGNISIEVAKPVILVSIAAGIAVLLASRLSRSERRFWVFVIVLSILLLIWQVTPVQILGYVLNTPQNPTFAHPTIFTLSILVASLVLIVSAVDYYSTLVNRRVWSAGILLTFVALLGFSGWQFRLPTTALSLVDIYTPLKDDAENYLILDYPIGLDSLAHQQENAQIAFGLQHRAAQTTAYVPVHQKRIVGGLVTAVPESQIATYADNPFLQLAAYQSSGEGLVETARAVQWYTRMWRLGYIFVHLGDGDETHIERWLAWTGEYCFAEQTADVAIWIARWMPDRCTTPYTIDIGSSLDTLAIGEGWYPAESWGDTTVRWAGMRNVSRMQFWLMPSSDYELELRALSPLGSDQVLTVRANGTIVGVFELEQDWQSYHMIIPREMLLSSQLLEVDLEHSSTIETGGRILTAAYDHVVFRPIEK